MKRRVVAREAAMRDLDACAVFIAGRSPQAAMRFLEAVEQSFQQLAEMPALGAAYHAFAPDLRGMRHFRVKKFEDYWIFYLPLADGIEVVRILHGARDIEGILES